MSEVKRYVCFYDTFMEAESQEDVNGEWVKYEDYARLHSQFANSEQENARLKAEVERLTEPAVMGGYNISEYIRMANSETLEFDNGDIFTDMTLPERIKYIVKSHSRLQAEVVLWEDYARLQAEVERLRSLSANSEWQPIETAPKDGQDILAYRHPHGAFLIPYYWGNDTYQMTHWMPLPKPPAAKEGKPSV